MNKKGDHNIKIGFSEHRVADDVNALIANVIEYGKSDQPAKPFLAPAKLQIRQQVLETMKTTLALMLAGD